MSLVKQELAAAKTEGAKRSNAIQELWKKITDEQDGDPTPAQQDEIMENSKAIETIKDLIVDLEAKHEVEQDIKRFGREMGTAEPVVPTDEKNHPQPKKAKSLGERFVESEGYKALRDRGFGGGTWSTGPIELPDLDTKALLTTDGASGGDLIVPDYRPGVVQTLFERLTVADLMASGSTSSNTVHYMKETAASNSAAGVAEGAAKPESALVFDAVDEPVRKIATWLPVTEEMLEDAPQIQSYINARLSLFVQIKEEADLLAGDGTAPNISGILDRTGIQTQARGSDSNEVAIYKALDKVRTTFLEPDAIVIHPNNYQTIRLAKDSSGQYYGGGPFVGPYGGPQGPASTNYYAADNLWGKKVVVTSAITAGTALVGAFATAAQVFRKSGLTVEASNSHDTYFVLNKVAIRAEERLALAVFREAAFAKVTSLN